MRVQILRFKLLHCAENAGFIIDRAVLLHAIEIGERGKRPWFLTFDEWILTSKSLFIYFLLTVVYDR